jgi:hypothetical protein
MPQQALEEKNRRASKAETLRDALRYPLFAWFAYVSSEETENRNWKTETRNWKIETRNWKIETRNWRIETRKSKLGIRPIGHGHSDRSSRYN